MSDESVRSFEKFALAFEESFAANDWSAVEACATDDVVWVVAGAPPPIGGAWEGREKTLGAIRASVDGFDRRFDLREPRALEEPTPIPGGGVHLRWVVVYRRDGLPPLELHGEEWDFFRDGKLEFHRERIANAGEVIDFLTKHGEKLRPPR